MDLTYTVRGADGKDYGPVSFEQLVTWVRERRLIPQQEVRRSDMQHWAPAGSFTELESLFSAAESTSDSTPQLPANASGSRAPDAATIARIRSAGSWFYWIAGLSLVNTIIAFSGSSWRFLFGLGLTQLFDQGLGGTSAASLLLSVIVVGFCAVLGVFANRGHLWAFIVGMVLFALDGVIFLIGQAWLGVGFHVLVLFFLFRGLQACLSLRAV